MNKTELLKELLDFTKRFTNATDEIIYEDQNGTNPVQLAEQYLEGTDINGNSHNTEASERENQ